MFLVYQFTNAIILFYHVFILQRAPWTHKLACQYCIKPLALEEKVTSLSFRTVTVSIVTFITMIVTCLAIASPKQPSSKIWGGFINDSGWSNKGIVFLTGLVSPNYGFAGLDGSIHLAEDCINATTVVPFSTICSVVTGFFTGFFFSVAMLYCISDMGSLLSSPTEQVPHILKDDSYTDPEQHTSI